MTTAATSGVSDYAAAVRSAIGTLPPEGAGLLDGLDEHLAEIAAESDADLVATLGSPEHYASELRASAGLGPTPADASPPLPGAFGASAPAEGFGATSPAPTVGPPRLSAPLLSPLRRRLAARVVLAIAAVCAVIVVSRTLNPAIVVAAAFVAGGWLVVRRLAAVAEIPATWAARLPWVTGLAALFLAVLLGTRLDVGSQPSFVDQPYGPTRVTIGARTIPELRGMPLPMATMELHNLGISFTVVDLEPGARSERYVVATDPAAGSFVSSDSFLGVTVAASPNLGTGPSPLQPTTTTATTALSTPTTSASPTSASPTSAPATSAPATSAPATSAAPTTVPVPSAPATPTPSASTTTP